MVQHLTSLHPDTAKLCISNSLDYFIRHYWHLRLAHLAQAIITQITAIKTLYVTQLILNWSWTPLFFGFHLTGLSLVVLGVMDILVGTLIWLAYWKMRAVSLLMIPYLSWILFATYLNFYIWQYN